MKVALTVAFICLIGIVLAYRLGSSNGYQAGYDAGMRDYAAGWRPMSTAPLTLMPGESVTVKVAQ